MTWIHHILKFVDATKLYSKVNRSGNNNKPQRDLEKLEKWSEKWKMVFNFDKCKCFHLGHGNLNLTYKMGSVNMHRTKKEKDLWGTQNANLKLSEQCGITVLKAKRILVLINLQLDPT